MTEKDGGILDDYVGAEMRSSGVAVLVVPNALDVYSTVFGTIPRMTTKLPN